MARDVVIGIAAAIILVGVLLAVLLYGAQRSPEPEDGFTIRWEPREASLAPQASALNPSDGERPHSFVIEERNLTSVTARVSWNDEQGNNDEFNLRVEPPDPLDPKPAVRGRSGALEITHTLAPAPTKTQVQGTDRDAAANEANETFGRNRGRGVWMVHITLVSAPGLQPIPGGPTTNDGVEEYSITVQYTYYQAAL